MTRTIDAAICREYVAQVRAEVLCSIEIGCIGLAVSCVGRAVSRFEKVQSNVEQRNLVGYTGTLHAAGKLLRTTESTIGCIGSGKLLLAQVQVDG